MAVCAVALDGPGMGDEPVGQSNPISPIALVVEDDASLRKVISILLKKNHYVVMECESAEAAVPVLRKLAAGLTLLITDVNLAGRMNGVELAFVARQQNPHLAIIVTSGRPLSEPLPDRAEFWAKPWPARLLRETAMLQASAGSF